MPNPGLRKAAKHAHGALARKIGVHIVTGGAQPGDVLAGEVEPSEELRACVEPAAAALAATRRTPRQLDISHRGAVLSPTTPARSRPLLTRTPKRRSSR